MTWIGIAIIVAALLVAYEIRVHFQAPKPPPIETRRPGGQPR